MNNPPQQVLVIGGGAGGFFGAIACGMRARELGIPLKITILEAGRAPLAKVRISGGGRCNVTHACFDPAALVQHYPRGGKALRGAFSRFQPRDTVAWFQERGVELKTEADGRMFPVSDESETIIQCLQQAAREVEVDLRTGTPAIALTRHTHPPGDSPDTSKHCGFIVTLKSGENLMGDRLLLATGSSPQGYRLAQVLGHHIVPPVPSLFTLNIPDPQLRSLAGVAVDPVRLRLKVGPTQLEHSGPVLITHWGLSGPAVLKLSAWGARALHSHQYQGTLSVQWLPQLNPETLRDRLWSAKSQLARKHVYTQRPVMLPSRLWQYLCDRLNISPTLRWADLSKVTLNQLVQELTQGQFGVQGKGVFKEEFVTCGGVDLKEVDFKTMASRCCPGLYFAGEILDIDGITGGFNFQSAWTTAWLAGRAIAESGQSGLQKTPHSD